MGTLAVALVEELRRNPLLYLFSVFVGAGWVWMVGGDACVALVELPTHGEYLRRGHQAAARSRGRHGGATHAW